MDTDSYQDTEEGSALTPAEAGLLRDLRRICEARTRLEATLAEAHHALLRAHAVPAVPVGRSEEQSDVD